MLAAIGLPVHNNSLIHPSQFGNTAVTLTSYNGLSFAKPRIVWKDVSWMWWS